MLSKIARISAIVCTMFSTNFILTWLVENVAYSLANASNDLLIFERIFGGSIVCFSFFWGGSDVLMDVV